MSGTVSIGVVARGAAAGAVPAVLPRPSGRAPSCRRPSTGLSVPFELGAVRTLRTRRRRTARRWHRPAPAPPIPAGAGARTASPAGTTQRRRTRRSAPVAARGERRSPVGRQAARAAHACARPPVVGSPARCVSRSLVGQCVCCFAFARCGARWGGCVAARVGSGRGGEVVLGAACLRERASE